MRLPDDMELPDKISRKTHCLSLHKNLYGTKQAACVWYNWLKNHIEYHECKKPELDDCVFIKHDHILLVHTENVLFCEQIIDGIISSLSKDLE